MKESNWIGFLPFYLLTVILFVVIAQGGSNAVTAVKQNTPVYRDYRFVVDAGHGGVDGGATSCTGVLESKINLQIALKLNDLMQFLGYETVMVRTTDTSIHTKGDSIAAQKVSDLKERVRIVNEIQDAILISIHQNYFQDSQYHGAQVFYGKNGQAFAETLQSHFLTTLNIGSKRNCKTAKGIYLMEKIDCVGVLVECGFLSNPEEERNLRDKAYQNKICCVIAGAASTYVNDHYVA